MSDTKPVEKRIDRAAVIALAREHIAAMPMGAAKAVMMGLADYAELIPSQIQASVQAEREAWIGTLRRLSDVCTDQEMAEVYEELIAAIRSRGETPPTPNQSEQ